MRNLGVLLLTAVISILLVAHVAAGDYKRIKIATEGAYPPWNFYDATGNLVGFDIDLTKDLCKRMNIDYEFVPQKWRGIFKGLVQRKYDAIIAAVSITESRKKLVNFSRSYADEPTLFLVRKDNPAASFPSRLEKLTLNDITPPEQAAIDAIVKEFTGKIIGVQVATTYEKFAEQYLGDHAEIRIYDFQHTIDLELWQGRLDASIVGMGYWMPLINSIQGKDYMVIGPQMTGGLLGKGIGVAVRKQDKELADLFSDAIDEALRDGIVKELAIKWFTFDISPAE